MDKWIREQSDMVDRRIVSLDWEGKTARAVITERTYPTDIEDLWDAIVTPERLQRWFLPVSGDLREGGNYQLEGNAGGTISRCEAPSFLAVTWEINGGIGWVNVKLGSVSEDATRITLEHIAHDDEETLAFWEQFGPGALGIGWDVALLGLADFLKDGSDIFAGGEEAFMKSTDGRGFAVASSNDWVAASIKFGTDARAAHEAGARTLAFYTGEEVA